MCYAARSEKGEANMQDEATPAIESAHEGSKRAWEAPRIFRAELDDTEANIRPGPEIIIYVS